MDIGLCTNQVEHMKYATKKKGKTSYEQEKCSVLQKISRKKYLAKASGVDWIGRITVFFSYLDGFN